MALNYEVIMNRVFAPVRASHSKRDTILYALGVGAGQADPCDPQELLLTYEEQLEALPTMAVTLCPPGFWIMEPELAINWKMLLHGEQRLTMYRPLPTEGEVIGQEKVEAIYDKGAGKGAIMRMSRTLTDAASGELIGVSEATAFLRGDGGFGGNPDGAPKPHPTPERAPDLSIALTTRPEQALIYRLSGDYNPLHIDPTVARSGGFDRPILHGLCSYGVAARALVRAVGEGAPSRLRRFDARFSAPVFPGETIVTDIWNEGNRKAAFRCRVQERDLVVITNGYAEFAV
ncbi:MaoC/PaaZ C-terminal domain-containing protein [Aromatoleum petrolei]|uniref:3-alpha,7-alpha, 12-alpha-trihydroxy-5-beta-cholest-24-enoyl-CoA hydratase n=1 Tax=Aromatoleum petrolei TaxID=76116 RepID=A0ABX1MN01_9RHOO|nr:MaoC/PaaZ C-terminal domain-containing protein [Aromatoleum petrolei]NMF88581.1 3-alpha,7-alpha,12-alpha-trihydroxy-5-beta-cholest-24-enoyl-CoA hydratase [Aromatoleum petrolei]QTQ34711.1 MaoC like domain-containing protein [Aromatoleum petrolei]